MKLSTGETWYLSDIFLVVPFFTKSSGFNQLKEVFFKGITCFLSFLSVEVYIRFKPLWLCKHEHSINFLSALFLTVNITSSFDNEEHIYISWFGTSVLTLSTEILCLFAISLQ